MQVYEITPQYHLVRLGNEEPLDRPDQIVRYMEGAFAAEPTVESVWVIALNTKFRPLGRVKISSGTLTSNAVRADCATESKTRLFIAGCGGDGVLTT